VPDRARVALTGAGASLLLLALTWFAAFHLSFAAHADRAIFNGFGGLQRVRVNHLAKLIASLCDPQPYLCFAALIVLVALARRRPRLALATAAILLGATATTELLKPLLAAPRVLSGQVAAASWPSGHATAAMSLALSAVLAAPARLRPAVAALGAAFAVAVSYSFLHLGWHYPSDVLGGFLVAATWTLLVIAALLTIEARRGEQPSTVGSERLSLRTALTPPALALAGAAALIGLVALARPHEVIVYVRGHEAFIVGASAIAALGLVLATAVMMLNVRR
jgi:membrane-associated phospholipid phosphatase